MKGKTIKKIFLLSVLVFVFLVFGFSFVYAQFDTATGIPVNLASDYPSFTAAPTIADMIASIYTYALSIAGILAIAMIVYGGISYALQPGNAAKQNDAKDIMQSAIWGIVLLAGAYVILKAVNPDLVILRNPGFTLITDLQTLDLGEIENDTGGILGGTSIGCTPENTDIQKTAQLAGEILSLNPSFAHLSCGEKGAWPDQNLKDVQAGKSPVVCNWSGSEQSCGACTAGGPGGKTTICPSLLEGLLRALKSAQSGAIPPFIITSITGQLHSETSPHYKGYGLDVSVSPSGDVAKWNAVLNEFKKYAGTGAMCEYKDASGKTHYDRDDCSRAFASGTSNQHIHVTFGGAGTMNNQELNIISKAAQEYLKLNPNLLSGYSYGIPPVSVDQSCTPKWTSSPKDNVIAVAQGAKPFVCDGGHLNLPGDVDFNNFNKEVRSDCVCNQGGQNGNVTIHQDVFKLLGSLEIAKKDRNPNTSVPDFKVVAITGGIQKGSGNQVSTNYSGTTFDIVPTSLTRPNLEKLKKFIDTAGYTAFYTYLEVEKGNNYSTFAQTAKFSQKYTSNLDDVPDICLNSRVYNGLDKNNTLYALFIDSLTPISTDPLVYNLKGACTMLRIHVIAHQT